MKGKRHSYVLAFLALALVLGFFVVPVGAQAQTLSVDEINNQINSLLKQLVALLTTQLQGLQQQLAVKLGQQPAVTTPPATTAATTTAQTTATSTAATSTAATSTAVVTTPTPQVLFIPKVRIGRALSFPVISITVATSSTSTISITASATNDDGSSSNIASVVFTDIATTLGTDTASPYTLASTTLAAGIHTISGVATDVLGQARRSASTTLTTIPW